MKPTTLPKLNRATRITASTLGVLVGLAGIEHGVFELLQGNVAPSGLLIQAIGPAQRFWQYGTERALTVIPSLLVTGIMAIVLGMLVAAWAAFLVPTKHGAIVLLVLSVALFLVGGGFAPIFITIVASATATRIHSPLAWWRARLPARARGSLARGWPFTLIAFVLMFVVSVAIAIFGYPLVSLIGADRTYAVQSASALLMLVLMALAVIAALSHDTVKRDEAA